MDRRRFLLTSVAGALAVLVALVAGSTVAPPAADAAPPRYKCAILPGTSAAYGVNKLGDDQVVMLKLTLPDTDNLYKQLVEHPKVLRVLALSGGYSRGEACEKLARNNGVIASFSRALTEGLTAQQSDEEFNATLDQAIASIAKASAT